MHTYTQMQLYSFKYINVLNEMWQHHQINTQLHPSVYTHKCNCCFRVVVRPFWRSWRGLQLLRTSSYLGIPAVCGILGSLLVLPPCMIPFCLGLVPPVTLPAHCSVFYQVPASMVSSCLDLPDLSGALFLGDCLLWRLLPRLHGPLSFLCSRFNMPLLLSAQFSIRRWDQ